MHLLNCRKLGFLIFWMRLTRYFSQWSSTRYLLSWEINSKCHKFYFNVCKHFMRLNQKHSCPLENLQLRFCKMLHEFVTKFENNLRYTKIIISVYRTIFFPFLRFIIRITSYRPFKSAEKYSEITTIGI